MQFLVFFSFSLPHHTLIVSPPIHSLSSQLSHFTVLHLAYSTIASLSLSQNHEKTFISLFFPNTSGFFFIVLPLQIKFHGWQFLCTFTNILYVFIAHLLKPYLCEHTPAVDERTYILSISQHGKRKSSENKFHYNGIIYVIPTSTMTVNLIISLSPILSFNCLKTYFQGAWVALSVERPTF